MSKKYTVSVDFDGVLHSYTTPWAGEAFIPDPPVDGSLAWLVNISDHFDVVIHTTRGRTQEGREAVLRWLEHHGVDPDLVVTVTDQKVPALVYIDDRAFRFIGPGSLPTAQHIHDLRPWNK